MKSIRLLRINLVNFMGTKNRTIDFNESVTKIKGMNGCGKTTVYAGVMYLLFGKAIDGSEAKNVRPHDEHGNLIHYIDVIVNGIFSVNGRSVELKKTTREKYVQKRGQTEKVFQGNECIYEVNGIPKSEKDYKIYIAENFCPEDVFLACTNASSFFRLDTKKRRAKLIELAKEFSDFDVIATNSEFYGLEFMLKDGTVDELIARSKGIIKRFNDTLKLIPARIDEQEKSKVDVDVAELELERNALKRHISEIDEKIADISKQYEEYQAVSDGILEIKFAMSDMQRKANESLVHQRKEIQSQIDKKTQFLMNIHDGIVRNNREIAGYKNDIEMATRERNRLSEQWKSVNAEVFDESTTICPTCHRELPKEEIESLREQFEKSKEIRLYSIVEEGNMCKEDIENATDMIPKLEECNKTNKEKRSLIEAEVAELEKELTQIAQLADISNTEEYKALSQKLAEKEVFLQNGNSANVVSSRLELEKKSLLLNLEDVNARISKAERNSSIDERILELQKEMRSTSQLIANEEKTLDLLERFNIEKMKMLTETVNKHFKIVQWRLFTENINGGYSDVCQAMVNGSNYDTCLNTGHKILADIDISMTMQGINEVQIPIFVDNAEALNDFNVPNIDNQLILLKVSDCNDMEVE